MTVASREITTIAVLKGTHRLWKKFVANNEFSNADDALRALMDRWEHGA